MRPRPALDNSTRGLAGFLVGQLPKKTFRSYMLANLTAHHLAAMPALYHLA